MTKQGILRTFDPAFFANLLTDHLFLKFCIIFNFPFYIKVLQWKLNHIELKDCKNILYNKYYMRDYILWRKVFKEKIVDFSLLYCKQHF